MPCVGRKSTWCKRLTAILVIGCAFPLSSTQAQQKPLGPTPPAIAIPNPELLKVPVSTLFPGTKPPLPSIKDPASNDPAAAQRGRQYFINFNCIGCHADNGGGGMGPALSNRAFIYGSAPQNIFLTIYQGRPAGMPAWGDVLPSTVIWDLVSYVKSISQAPASEWGSTISSASPKIQQVPAEFQATDTPWAFTEPFTDGQAPQQ